MASFDDGFKEFLTDALPLLHRYGIPTTLFIPPGIVGGDGLFPWLHRKKSSRARAAGTAGRTSARDAMTVVETKEVAQYPWVSIGSHTVSHTVTPSLTEWETLFELGESRRLLESWTRGQVECFAYPEGRVGGREGLFLSECGYRLAATTESAFITPETDPYLVPRFNVADEIWFPEAVCKMVGVWQPAIVPLAGFLERWRALTAAPASPSPQDDSASA